MQAFNCGLYPCFNSMLGVYDANSWQCDGCFLNPVKGVSTKKVIDNFMKSAEILKQKLVAKRSDEYSLLLARMKGFANIKTLSLRDKETVWQAEMSSNNPSIGVFDCLLKSITIAVSQMKCPKEDFMLSRLFFKNKRLSSEIDFDEVVNPAMPFESVRLAMISSPSKEVRHIFSERMFVGDGDELILIGFD